MLEAFIDFICAISFCLFGYYLIKKILDCNISLSKQNIIIILANTICIIIIHILNYKFSYIFSYFINIITYKLIFKIKTEESMIATGILMLLIVAADLSFFPILSIFSSLKHMENNQIVFLISNFGVLTIAYIYTKVNIIFKPLKKNYMILIKKDQLINITFIIIVLITIALAVYNIFINNYDISRIINDSIIIIVMVSITAIFSKRQEKYLILSEQYNSLFNYVQNFEDWVEREQFIRHEYKNQLAIIYAISNEKEVKEKVNDILKNTINIGNEQINQLKVLPKGGLKGLMYYKTSIALSQKINLTINVSIKTNGILNKLNKKKNNELTKILGIYYDNAIEAAKESRKKIILIEIYELKDKVNIVISNTFKKSSIVDRMNAKGISSKGEGRGNGLYFADKIIEKNKWIETNNKIIDYYYIETITIKKNTSKK